MAKRPAKKATKPAAKSGGSKSKPKTHAKPVRKTAAPAKGKSAASRPAAAPPRIFRQVPTPPPPPPLATPKPPAADAVSAFERGMAELQRHNYAGAKTTFQGLLDNFPSEGFLTDRARVYLQLADRELQRRPASSGSVEERLTAATAALNNNDDAEAGRLAESAFKDDRSQDLAVYLMAIVAARQGRTDDALAHIKMAIEINPESRVQARQDEEFDILLELDEFHTLTEAPPTPAPAQLPKKPIRKGK
jgi:tetratricopeptide (TPR) repeat protein